MASVHEWHSCFCIVSVLLEVDFVPEYGRTTKSAMTLRRVSSSYGSAIPTRQYQIPIWLTCSSMTYLRISATTIQTAKSCTVCMDFISDLACSHWLVLTSITGFPFNPIVPFISISIGFHFNIWEAVGGCPHQKGPTSPENSGPYEYKKIFSYEDVFFLVLWLAEQTGSNWVTPFW